MTQAPLPAANDNPPLIRLHMRLPVGDGPMHPWTDEDARRLAHEIAEAFAPPLRR